MIYIEFCIQKSISTFLGVSYFWVSCPPKSQLLAGSTPNAWKEGHSTRPVGRIFKKSHLRLYIVLRLGYNPSRRNYASFQYPRCPNQKTKKSAVFAHFGTVFNQMVEASRFSRWDVIPSTFILQPRRRTEKLREDFWKTCLRAEI